MGNRRCLVCSHSRPLGRKHNRCLACRDNGSCLQSYQAGSGQRVQALKYRACASDRAETHWQCSPPEQFPGRYLSVIVAPELVASTATQIPPPLTPGAEMMAVIELSQIHKAHRALSLQKAHRALSLHNANTRRNVPCVCAQGTQVAQHQSQVITPYPTKSNLPPLSL